MPTWRTAPRSGSRSSSSSCASPASACSAPTTTMSGPAAEWLAERMRAIGLEHVEVCRDRRPSRRLRRLAARRGAPTVIVYAHYDVQPVDPLEEWVRPPFEPRIEEGRVFARGAADDKGQVHLHLWAARAWLETAGRLPVNVRYVIEGEEEAGSPNFEAWLVANRERLDGRPRGRHRHRLLRGQPAGRHGRPARQHVPAGGRHGSQPGPPLGQLRAASSRTLPTPSCASWPRCATVRVASRAGLLRRRPRADTGRAGGPRGAALRRGGLRCQHRRVRALRRARPHPAGAAWCPADPGHLRPVVRLPG